MACCHVCCYLAKHIFIIIMVLDIYLTISTFLFFLLLLSLTEHLIYYYIAVVVLFWVILAIIVDFVADYLLV